MPRMDRREFLHGTAAVAAGVAAIQATAGPSRGEVQKAMIQIAHRRLNFGRKLRLPEPSSDVCILHKRLANRRADT